MASYCKSEMLSIAISLSQKAKVNKSQFIPGPSFTKLFGRTKFINAMKRQHCKLVRQIHVIHGFVKLAPSVIN